MNLIESKWLPVKRQSGEVLIAPWQITELENPVLTLAAPRPDFNGALIQFLIGLLQTAYPPENDEQWGEWLENPPSPATLKEHFLSVAHAFDLNGDGPRFMQDISPLQGDEKPVANLLIDIPGANALKHNTDHFIKRGSVEKLCSSCTANALYTLQTNAPAGGAGHRTSLRGGGPLTTLVVLDPKGSHLEDTLWHACWLNVLNKNVFKPQTNESQLNQPQATFPWLAATRTSEPKGGVMTTPLDTHPLQMFWGMPRRIQINWTNLESGHCDLCNDTSNQLVTRYTTKNRGINYNGAWMHPLSPHIFNKKKEPLPQHAQPGGLNYRHWLGLFSETENSVPAQVVRSSQNIRQISGEQFRMWAFGYDMDNMKARCWYETTFPLYSLNEEIREKFTLRTEQLILAATDTASVTRKCIKEAWFKRPGDAKGDTAYLTEAFLHHTETDFYERLKQLKLLLNTGLDDLPVRQQWHNTLLTTSEYLFDYWTSRGDFETVNPRRIAQARKKLTNWLWGKKLRADTLHLPKK